MGANFSAPFALLRPVEVDPLKYAEQYQNLANLAQLRQYRQQEMAASQQTMQENAIKLQEMQQGLTDHQIIQARIPELMQDPIFRNQDGSFNWPKGFEQIASEGKVSQNGIADLQKRVGDLQKSGAEVDKFHADRDKALADAAKLEREGAEAGADRLANWAQDELDNPDGVDPASVLTHLTVMKSLHPEATKSIDNVITNINADPTHAQGFLQSLAGQLSQAGRTARQTLREKTAEVGQKEAGAAKAKFDLGVQMLQSLPTDPATGLPTQESWTATKQAHSELNLPDTPDQATIDRLRRSLVPVAEQPKYDLETSQAKALKAMTEGSPKDLDDLIDGIVPK